MYIYIYIYTLFLFWGGRGGGWAIIKGEAIRGIWGYIEFRGSPFLWKLPYVCMYHR